MMMNNKTEVVDGRVKVYRYQNMERGELVRIAKHMIDSVNDAKIRNFNGINIEELEKNIGVVLNENN